MSMVARKKGEEYVEPKYKYSFQRVPLVAVPEGKSMTKQSYKKETDAKEIVKKFQRTGYLENMSNLEAFYGDFTEVNDYKSAMDAVRGAETAFNELPSAVRNYFDNDPDKLVQFVNEPKNYEKAIELGILDKDRTKAYLDAKRAERIKAEESEKAKEEAAKEAANSESSNTSTT